MIEERYDLCMERLTELIKEETVPNPYRAYFRKTAHFLLQIDTLRGEIASGRLETDSLEALRSRNQTLYKDILPAAYGQSYANPTFAVSCMGTSFGRLLSFLYTELRGLIAYAYEKKCFEMTIRMELFLEVYHMFYDAAADSHALPAYSNVQKSVCLFALDYVKSATQARIREQLNPKEDFAVSVIQKSDWKDVRYLYRFGEYITDKEEKTARHLAAMPAEKIAKMADTFTEGFRQGFINGRKDLSRKQTVNIRYCLGFERVVAKAMDNFAQMGLSPVIYRAGVSIFTRRNQAKIGYYGAIANHQFEYDHKDDEALILDRRYLSRKLEVLRNAYEEEKTLASYHAGPACIEVFGEAPFWPLSKQEAFRFSGFQQKLSAEYTSESGLIVNDYIKGEERSFTIIAFPVPAIGQDYEEIFEAVLRLNTLDDKQYAGMQQIMIDTLDRADSVLIRGGKGNRTDMRICFTALLHPEKETLFENCVADVNIPIGEVFTSPKLQHTEGILHVGRVFLNGLEYRDLEIGIKDGWVSSYTCANFEKEEDNLKYIRENLLFHHESLPLGEFAIGTNTTAYMMAKKYDIADKLPILIAEKMGPHFALGDTCYSHSEDVKVYNPNGKEIIARDNSASSLRLDPSTRSRAYFNAHTDITIPYDELHYLAAVTAKGEEIPIIRDGRFVLPGCEALNLPFDR